MSEGDEAERAIILAELTAVDPDFVGDLEPEPDCGPPDESEYDEQDLSDLTRAIGLLTGAWDNAKAAKRYLKGHEERKAREAIGRLLRSSKPLDSALRYQLAEMFDQLPPYVSFENAPIEREIIFKFIRPGKPDVTLRNLHLASDYRVLIESGIPHKKAVDKICKKYNVSDTAVKEARRQNPRASQGG
jgi:hypothetical protein